MSLCPRDSLAIKEHLSIALSPWHSPHGSPAGAGTAVGSEQDRVLEALWVLVGAQRDFLLQFVFQGAGWRGQQCCRDCMVSPTPLSLATGLKHCPLVPDSQGAEPCPGWRTVGPYAQDGSR